LTIDVEDIQRGSLAALEDKMITYNRDRVIQWANNVTNIGVAFGETTRADTVFSATVAEIVAILGNCKYRNDQDIQRRLVRLAYECFTFASHNELPAELKQRTPMRTWNKLLLLAQPIHDCRMLADIAVKCPIFRNVKIIPVEPPRSVPLDSKYNISLEEALQRLGLGEHINKLCDEDRERNFALACSKPLGFHAEMQLLMRYSDQPHLQPTFQPTLEKLAAILVNRIDKWMLGSKEALCNQVPQSSIVSRINDTDLAETTERVKRLHLLEAERSNIRFQEQIM
jgi:hypothetical protein